MNYLETINIDLYEHALQYLKLSSQSHPTLLHFIVDGIKKNKLDVESNYKDLAHIFEIPFTSVSKIFFESYLFITKELIEINPKHIDQLNSVVHNYNFKHVLDNDVRKDLSIFLKKHFSLDFLTEQYPQLIDYYHNHNNSSYLTVSKSLNYTLNVNSNKIANDFNLSTSDVQNKLAKYFVNLQSIIETHMVLSKEQLQLISIEINNTGGAVSGIKALVENQESYELLSITLNNTVELIIKSIIENNPYELQDLKPLMATVVLEHKIKATGIETAPMALKKKKI